MVICIIYISKRIFYIIYIYIYNINKEWYHHKECGIIFFEFDFVFTSNIGFIQIYLPFDIDLKRPGRG